MDGVKLKPLRRRALPALVALWVVGCNQPEGSPLVRLVDVADRSIVAESPLLETSPPAEPASTPVWHSDFEGDALADLGWPSWDRGKASAWLEQASPEGQVVCVGAEVKEIFSVPIPARSLARYRVTRRLKTGWASLDLRVVESSIRLPRRYRAKEGSGAVLQDQKTIETLVGKSATLAVHRFSRVEVVEEEWVEDRVDFVTNLDTRTLVVGFESVGDASRPMATEACLAELVIERIEADPLQDLELIRSAWLPPTPEPNGLGLVKRGRLLPLRRVKASRPPYDENYGMRDALFAPAPTRLRFELNLPLAPRLSFAYGLSSGSRIGDEVEFEVVVEYNGGVESVFRQAVGIERDGEGWHWHEATVNLEPWSGEEITLELRTSSTTPRGFGLWGDPVVDTARIAGDPPNVVLIGIDTLRADRMSAWGHDRPTSPNLDRLAGDGVRFATAISASNWTAPSFASIFTGLPAARHGVVNQEFQMNAAVDTLAERLQSEGWRTHAVVYKAALYGLGLDQGFDRWLNLPTSNRIAQTNLDKALAILDREGDRRFFLFLHLDDPHQPFNQPAPFDTTFGDPEVRRRLGLELPISIRNAGIGGCEHCTANGRPTDEFIAEAQALYDAAVAYTDDRVGALIEGLRQRGLYENTVIAVVADHGEVIYDRYRLWGHGALLLADEMVHVPLILKPAGKKSSAGRVVEAQVRTTDLLPTLLEAAGLSGGEGPDARSLWPLIEGSGDAADNAADEDRVAYFENPQRSVVGLRTPQWKYVLREHGSGTFRQLYDLVEDPGEDVNLADDRPREVARLGELLASFLLRTREGPFLLVVGDGAEEAQRLEIEGAQEVTMRSLLGLRPGQDSLESSNRMLALLQLDLARDQRVRVKLSGPSGVLLEAQATGGAAKAYDPAIWERLLETPGIYFLRGPEQVGATKVGRPTNLDQVEDLRALGYID